MRIRLVPKPSPPPTFAFRMQAPKGEGMGDLVMVSGKTHWGQCPIVMIHKVCVDQSAE